MNNPYRQIEQGAPGDIGWRIDYYDEVGSTQDIAAAAISDGAAPGTVFIAEAQSAGRGRLGRGWISPAGLNLYMTIILRPGIAAESAPLLSLVAAVALAEALESVAPGMPQVKWPNDVWLRGKKTAGILAQMVESRDRGGVWVLLGIGINVNISADQLPAEISQRATSVQIETSRVTDRAMLAKILFARLSVRIAEFETSGFAPIAEVWERYSLLTSRQVTIIEGEKRYTGTVKGIGSDGALLLLSETGVLRIMTGDVTVEKT